VRACSATRRGPPVCAPPSTSDPGFPSGTEKSRAPKPPPCSSPVLIRRNLRAAARPPPVPDREPCITPTTRRGACADLWGTGRVSAGFLALSDEAAHGGECLAGERLSRRKWSIRSAPSASREELRQDRERPQRRGNPTAHAGSQWWLSTVRAVLPRSSAATPPLPSSSRASRCRSRSSTSRARKGGWSPRSRRFQAPTADCYGRAAITVSGASTPSDRPHCRAPRDRLQARTAKICADLEIPPPTGPR
jgi:hypothetical protein